MKKMKSVFLVLMLALSGCATIPKASIEQDQVGKKFEAPPDKSVIYIYRDEMMGGGVRMDVLIDGFLLGDMRTKSYMRAVVKPGPHTVLSRAENSSQVSVNAEPGKIYYVWQEAKMGLMYAGTALHLVDSGTGQRAILSCDLVEHSQPPQ